MSKIKCGDGECIHNKKGECQKGNIKLKYETVVVQFGRIGFLVCQQKEK